VWKRLADMVDRDRDGTVRFRSSLVRDAAYAGLPFRLRRELHARAGETVESMSPNPDEEAELLSFHFHEGRRYDRAWRFSRLAGARSEAKFAQSEARVFLQRALDASKHVGVKPKELASVWESLGDVEDRLGDYTSAESAYAKAGVVFDDAVNCARLTLKSGWMAQRVGRFRVALSRVTRARSLLDDVGSRRGARSVRAQVGTCEAAVRYQQGRFKEAVDAAERAAADAKASRDRSALAKAWYLMDMSLWALNRGDDAVHTEDALRIYEDLGDVDGAGGVMNNLGGYAYWRGEWDKAVELYERGREALERSGNTAIAALGDVNVGEILSDQGRLPDAQDCLTDAVRVFSAAGSGETPFAEALMGRTLARQGRFEEAHAILDRALMTEVYITEALAFEGRAEEALARGDAVLPRAEAEESFVAPLQRARGWALAQLGATDAAAVAMQASKDAAEEEGSIYEQAVTIEAIAMLGDACGGSPDPETLKMARDALAKLGVVRAPLPMTE
jgi:tetratricopeptide (TPR) repeat protein